jgi:catechol 2,3-dioxygenase-like lactoylglutathione lyase family enzyme
MKCLNLHHIGLWVENIDEMITFLTVVMGFRLLSRNPRGELGPGERAFVHIGDNQVFELLTEPHVQPRPDFAVHPIGHVAGIPHLCFRVTNLPEWKDKLEKLGYKISQQVPKEGFVGFALGTARTIWFVGPGGVGFELFEFEQEYSLEELSA